MSLSTKEKDLLLEGVFGIVEKIEELYDEESREVVCNALPDIMERGDDVELAYNKLHRMVIAELKYNRFIPKNKRR